MERLALSIKEAGIAAGLGRTTIYKAIKTRDLPILKVGKRSLVRPCDLQRWLDKNQK
jgi:excisionase family DNA binding protein